MRVTLADLNIAVAYFAVLKSPDTIATAFPYLWVAVSDP